MIAFFIALVFFALRNSLKAQQNRVWVGLSKETAHQLGTPISSLVAWIEFLKLKDIDPALLSEIDKDVHRLEMIARRFSKIGSATDLRQADLREVVRRSLGYMEKRISDKVRIDLDFPEHGVTVTVSEPLFDWVIENLLKMRWMPWAARERFCSIFPKGGERCFWIFPILEKVSRNHSSKPFFIPDSPPRSVVGDLACRL